jgi:hypothetical protein
MPIAEALTTGTISTGTTPASTVIGLARAERWHLVLSGDQQITAVRYRRRPGSLWGPWTSVSTGLPLSAGTPLEIEAYGQCALSLELEVTAAASGTTTYELAGT